MQPSIGGFTSTPRRDFDTLIASLAAHAPHTVELLRAARDGRIGVAQPTRECSISNGWLKRLDRPLLVVLGDDDHAGTGPAGWLCAARVLGWARHVIVHGARASNVHYAAVARLTELQRRVVLIECPSDGVVEWSAAVARLARRADVQTFIPPPGVQHPVPLALGAGPLTAETGPKASRAPAHARDAATEPVLTGAEQVNGRFSAGRSGNPKGRPAGARHHALEALDLIGSEGAAAALQVVVKAAHEGDLRACELLLKRCWPERKGRPIRFDMPVLGAAADLPGVLAAVGVAMGSGVLSPDEGLAVAGVLEAHRRALDLSDHDRRLDALERCAGDDDR